jgi:hypothetical protein
LPETPYAAEFEAPAGRREIHDAADPLQRLACPTLSMKANPTCNPSEAPLAIE